MNDENKDLATRVAEKKEQIQKYKEMLQRNIHSRWYWNGRETLEKLQKELDDLLNP